MFGSPGSGKCFAKGTKILMYDGTIKNVENVIKGDIVMGDDSTPRNVLEIHSGYSKMYCIKRTRSQDIVVSAGHIITLCRQKQNGTKKTKKWECADIQIEEYLEKSAHYQKKSYIYKTPVIFTNKFDFKIDPYYLGYWLGNGLSSAINRISTADDVIVSYLKEYSDRIGLTLKQHSYKQGACQTYTLSEGNNGDHSKHPLSEKNTGYNLIDNKHIPYQYKTSGYSDRMELLAGLVDSDGYLASGYIEFTNKNYTLAEDVQFLANSCGFRATLHEIHKSCGDFTGTYYMVNIGGEIEKIPVKNLRKKYKKKNRIRNALHESFTIVPTEDGEYYGFSTDGNQRFLLDDCTVVHNSTGAAYIFSMLKMSGIDAELITEFAKDKVWEENKAALENQAYIFGKQSFRMSRCSNKVRVIVTDSPILLSAFYNQNPVLGKPFNEVVKNVFNNQNNVNFLVSRTKAYNPNGRMQTEDESDEMAQKMKAMLVAYNVPFTQISGDESGYKAALEIIQHYSQEDREKNEGNVR